MSIGFSQDLFLSLNRDKLKQYVQCKHLQKELLKAPSPAKGCFMRSATKAWEVSYYFVALPFWALTFIFLKVIQIMPLGKSLSCRAFFLEAKLITQICDFPIKRRYSPLFRIVNHPGPLTRVGAHSSIPVGIIMKGLEINQMSTTRRKGNLSLRKVSKGGNCRALSYLFAYFVLQAKKRQILTTEKLIEIAQKLQYRGHEQAALLHSFLDNTITDLLDLNFYEPQFFNREEFLQQDLAKNLKDIPNGVYAVRLPRHQATLVKVDSNECYYFDPEGGLSLLDQKKPEKHLMKIIKSDLANWENRIAEALKDFPDYAKSEIEKLRKSIVTFTYLQCKMD